MNCPGIRTEDIVGKHHTEALEAVVAAGHLELVRCPLLDQVVGVARVAIEVAVVVAVEGSCMDICFQIDWVGNIASYQIH